MNPKPNQMANLETLKDFDFNGYRALESVINKTYGSMSQAIASLTLFSHPETVAQTKNKALFRIIRANTIDRRGEISDNERVVLCDNYSPQRAFLWANSLNYYQFKDVQFNHIYSLSNHAEYYTSLANICVTPVFLAKLTDTNTAIKTLLQYRAFDLYDFIPEGFATPVKPQDYEGLEWAACLKEVPNLAQVLEKRMIKNAKSRICISANAFGWLFSPTIIT